MSENYTTTPSYLLSATVRQSQPEATWIAMKGVKPPPLLYAADADRLQIGTTAKLATFEERIDGVIAAILALRVPARLVDGLEAAIVKCRADRAVNRATYGR